MLAWLLASKGSQTVIQKCSHGLEKFSHVCENNVLTGFWTRENIFELCFGRVAAICESETLYLFEAACYGAQPYTMLVRPPAWKGPKTVIQKCSYRLEKFLHVCKNIVLTRFWSILDV